LLPLLLSKRDDNRGRQHDPFFPERELRDPSVGTGSDRIRVQQATKLVELDQRDDIGLAEGVGIDSDAQETIERGDSLELERHLAGNPLDVRADQVACRRIVGVAPIEPDGHLADREDKSQRLSSIRQNRQPVELLRCLLDCVTDASVSSTAETPLVVTVVRAVKRDHVLSDAADQIADDPQPVFGERRMVVPRAVGLFHTPQCSNLNGTHQVEL